MHDDVHVSVNRLQDSAKLLDLHVVLHPSPDRFGPVLAITAPSDSRRTTLTRALASVKSRAASSASKKQGQMLSFFVHASLLIKTPLAVCTRKGRHEEIFPPGPTWSIGAIGRAGTGSTEERCGEDSWLSGIGRVRTRHRAIPRCIPQGINESGTNHDFLTIATDDLTIATDDRAERRPDRSPRMLSGRQT